RLDRGDAVSGLRVGDAEEEVRDVLLVAHAVELDLLRALLRVLLDGRVQQPNRLLHVAALDRDDGVGELVAIVGSRGRRPQRENKERGGDRERPASRVSHPPHPCERKYAFASIASKRPVSELSSPVRTSTSTVSLSG